jgi:hypothetical protein
MVRGELKCGDNTAYGCEYASSGRIKLSSDIPDHKLFQVVVHELGHAMAPYAGHVGAWQGIMSEYVSESRPYITRHDIELICRDYDCPCSNPEKPN